MTSAYELGAPLDPLVTPNVTAEVTHRADIAAIAVAGELDLCTVKILDRHITSALSHQPRRLVFDLTGVTFLSVAGVNLLIQARAIAAAQDCVVYLRGTHKRPVMIVLRTLGLNGMFPTM